MHSSGSKLLVPLLTLLVGLSGCGLWGAKAPAVTPEPGVIAAPGPVNAGGGGTCTAPGVPLAGQLAGVRPPEADETLPEAVCAWLDALKAEPGFITLREAGQTYLVAAPGDEGELTITRLLVEPTTLRLGYSLDGGKTGSAGVLLLAGDEALPIIQEPAAGAAWIPAVRNPDQLPAVPLTSDGLILVAAEQVEACPAQVQVSGFARLAGGTVLLQVVDSLGQLLGEDQTEVGGGVGDWASFTTLISLDQIPETPTGKVEALTVRHDAFELTASLPLQFLSQQPACPTAVTPLTVEAAHELFSRYEAASLQERLELFTTGKAAALWRQRFEEVDQGGSPKAEDWSLADSKLSIEADGNPTVVRMDYTSNFTGKPATMLWRLEWVADGWRIADWTQGGRWLP